MKRIYLYLLVVILLFPIGLYSVIKVEQFIEKSPDTVFVLNEDVFYKKKNLFLTTFFPFVTFRDIRGQHLCSLKEEIIAKNNEKKFYDPEELTNLFQNKCSIAGPENIEISLFNQPKQMFYRNKSRVCNGFKSCYFVSFEKDNRFILTDKERTLFLFFHLNKPFSYTQVEPYAPTDAERDLVKNNIAFKYIKGTGIGNQLFSFWSTALYAKKHHKGFITQPISLYKTFTFDEEHTQNDSFFAVAHSFFPQNVIKTEHEIPQDKDIMLLRGYMQSYQNIAGFDEYVRQATHFKKPLTEKNLTVAESMQTQESVAIHVRRGDYMYYKDYYFHLSPAYYQKAIAYMKKHLKNPRFYVFSDDIAWCKENLPQEESLVFIDWNNSAEDDLQLMTKARHFIIANSTFSWWGAFLSSNPNKITIVPDNWYAQGKQGHFYATPGSVIMENEK